jgi:hypothetical protein
MNIIECVNETNNQLTGVVGLQSNLIPYETTGYKYNSIGQDVQTEKFVDYLMMVFGDSVKVYAKYINGADGESAYTLLAQATLTTIKGAGNIRVYSNVDTVYKNFTVYQDTPLALSSAEDGNLLPAGNNVYITANKSINAVALESALTATANGVPVSVSVVDVSKGTSYKYKLAFDGGLIFGKQYKVNVANTLETNFSGYEFTFKTLPPVALGPGFIGNSVEDTTFRSYFDYFQDAWITTDVLSSNNLLSTDYGLSIRNSRAFKTKSDTIANFNNKDVALYVNGISLSDYADKTNYMKKNDVKFLEQTKTEFDQIYKNISELYDLGFDAFTKRTTKDLKKISDLQKEINILISSTRDEHVVRLSSKMYPVEVSNSIYSVLFSLQRISDHIVNIVFSIRSTTGSKAEAFQVIEREKRKLESIDRKPSL